MSNSSEQDLDFNSDDYNSFYYTNEKQIKKMDDDFLLSKITEKYPDIRKDKDENILKQAVLVMMNDTRFIQELDEKYDISPTELFKLIYRNYEFVFNKCFITKVQKTVKNKKYAKQAIRKSARVRRRASKSGTSRKVL